MQVSSLPEATIAMCPFSWETQEENGEKRAGKEGNKDSYLPDVENEVNEGQLRNKKRELSLLVISTTRSTTDSKAKL